MIVEFPQSIETRKVRDLIPHANNARIHSDEQIAQLAQSIKEWGWTIPVLIDEQGGIIAGHGRVIAATKLQLEEVPCIVASNWSDTKKRAYIIADNKLTMNGEWDDDLLRLELSEIALDNFDLQLTGFSRDEIKELVEAKEERELSEVTDESRNLLLVECDSERQLQMLFNEMRERGLECKVMS
jgi:ParB-like chromosome segregation protein Spo0J